MDNDDAFMESFVRDWLIPSYEALCESLVEGTHSMHVDTYKISWWSMNLPRVRDLFVIILLHVEVFLIILWRLFIIAWCNILMNSSFRMINFCMRKYCIDRSLEVDISSTQESIIWKRQIMHARDNFLWRIFPTRHDLVVKPLLEV